MYGSLERAVAGRVDVERLNTSGQVRTIVATPRDGRVFVKRVLADHCAQAIETAELLVSELVTNAIRHGGTDRVEVEVSVRDGHAVLGVFDSSPEWPEPRRVDSWDVGGRGLLLVEHLAHRWGVDPTGTGKNVWVELPCGGHDAATDA